MEYDRLYVPSSIYIPAQMSGFWENQHGVFVLPGFLLLMPTLLLDVKVTKIPMMQAVKTQSGANCPVFKSGREIDLDVFEVGHFIIITLIICSQLKLLQLFFNMGLQVTEGPQSQCFGVLGDKNTAMALAADGGAFFCLFGLWSMYLCSTAELQFMDCCSCLFLSSAIRSKTL